MSQTNGDEETLVVRRTQRARSEATRATLMGVARLMFGQLGFIGTNLVELATTAAMSKGALYHHFQDKESLFEAVAIEVAQEVSDTASHSVLAVENNTWERFLAGQRTYLELVANRPEAQRILLIDGPAVLGWERWRHIQTEVVLPGTIYGVSKLMVEGYLRPGHHEILAHLILAALNDAAMAVANAPDPKAARTPVTDALMQLLEGLAAPIRRA